MDTDTDPTELTTYYVAEIDGRELTIQQIGVDAEGVTDSIDDLLYVELADGAVLERDEAERVARERAAAHGWELDRFELDSGNGNGYNFAAWPAS